MSSRTNQSGDEAAADRPRLRRSARSTRLARPIDPPYWESLGFNESESMNLSNFTYITTNDKTDFVAPFPHNGDNFTPFHEQLLPHWRAFAKTLENVEETIASIEGNTGKAAATLTLADFHLPKEVFKMIGPAMSKMSHLREIMLENCMLGSDGLLAVAETIQYLSSVTTLGLPNNEITCVDSARAFSAALKNSLSLECICLTACGLGKNGEVLEVILDGCRGLMSIYLDYNGINSSTVGAVAKFIDSNHDMVKVLDLERNAISDEDVPSLVASLKKNTHMRILDLTGNDLSVVGRTNMLKAMFDTTSMNDVVASNHTCELRISSTEEQIEAGGLVSCEIRMQALNLMDESKEIKVRYKVSHALQQAIPHTEGEINLQCFNRVPVKCFPRVLDLAQKQLYMVGQTVDLEPGIVNCTERDGNDLGRLFNIMRNMPDLFSYRGSKSSPTAKVVPGKRKRRS